MKKRGMKRELIPLILFFFGISIAFIHSAGFVEAMDRYNSGIFFVKRQFIWYIIGFILMLIFSSIDYKKYKDNVGWIYFLGIVLLILVLIMGKDVNGAKRWIRLGGFSIQPSEFAKLIFIIFFAGILDKYGEKGIREIELIKSSFFPMIIYVGLIFLEKDLSTSLHLFVIYFLMLFLADVRILNMIMYAIGFLFVGLIGILTSDYRRARFENYIDKLRNKAEITYQTKQSLIAIGNGGFLGAGFGNGVQKYYYLPERHTDYIFSIMAEEFGFMAGIALFISYLALLLIGIRAVNRTKNYFGKYLAMGIVIMILSQALMNLYVVTALIPSTGIPLPFISYGGSSICMLLISVGILLNIIKNSKH